MLTPTTTGLINEKMLKENQIGKDRMMYTVNIRNAFTAVELKAVQVWAVWFGFPSARDSI